MPPLPPTSAPARPPPAGAKYKLCVVQFKVPGAKNGGSDKGPDGNRVDSIPIANSVIAAGGAYAALVARQLEKSKEVLQQELLIFGLVELMMQLLNLKLLLLDQVMHLFLIRTYQVLKEHKEDNHQRVKFLTY